MDFEYPSTAFPPRPNVTISLPETFEPIMLASVLIGAGDTDPNQAFRANLVVICTRTINDMTLDEVAADLRAKTASEFADARMTPTEHAILGGFDSLTTITAMTPANVGFEIEQAQTVIFVPTVNDEVRDLLQIHASYATDTRDHYAPLFLEALKSIRIV